MIISLLSSIFCDLDVILGTFVFPELRAFQTTYIYSYVCRCTYSIVCNVCIIMHGWSRTFWCGLSTWNVSTWPQYVPVPLENTLWHINTYICVCAILACTHYATCMDSGDYCRWPISIQFISGHRLLVFSFSIFEYVVCLSLQLFWLVQKAFVNSALWIYTYSQNPN